MRRLSHTAASVRPVKPWVQPSSGARARCAARVCTSAMAPTMRATRPPNWCSLPQGWRTTWVRARIPRPLPARRRRADRRLLRAARSRSAYRSPISPIGLFLPASNCMSTNACWCRDRPSPNSFCSVSSPGWTRAACAGSWMSGPARARSRWPAPWRFPKARVDAVDVSAAALQVARRNRRRLSLQERVRDAAIGSFRRRAGMPLRYHREQSALCRARGNAILAARIRHEPRLGLASGVDGLDSVRAIFAAASRHLSRNGILVVEVGNTEDTLLRTFPRTAVCVAGDCHGRRRRILAACGRSAGGGLRTGRIGGGG